VGVIRRSDGREWRIEPSAEGIPLVFGDSRYPHDPPRVASELESALAERLAGAVREALTVREAFAVASAEVQACAENGDDPACVRSALSTTTGGQ
jgi:hypothetical protein